MNLAATYPLMWVFLVYSDMGYAAYPIAVGCCNLLFNILGLIVLCTNGYAYIFRLRPMSAVLDGAGVKQYLALSTGAFSAFFDIFSNEAVVLLAGYVENSSVCVATAVIFNTIYVFLVYFSLSLATAISTRIGQYVGADLVGNAKRTVNVSLALQTTLNLVMCGLLFAFADAIVLLFISDDAEVQALCVRVFYLLVLEVFFVFFVKGLQAIFNGVGQPQKGALLVFVSYYALPFPTLLILLFAAHLNADLFYGTVCLFGFLCVSRMSATLAMLCVVLCKLDWTQIREASKERSAENEKTETEKETDANEFFADGLRLMNNGSLNEAILAFEACVEAEPERAEAWRYLGISVDKSKSNSNSNSQSIDTISMC